MILLLILVITLLVAAARGWIADSRDIRYSTWRGQSSRQPRRC